MNVPAPTNPSLTAGRLFARAALADAPIDLPDALLIHIGSRLLRLDELNGGDRDAFGNWEPPPGRRPEWMVAEVDEAVIAARAGPPLSPGLWPGGHRFAVCVTHDVDGVSEKNHARRFVRRLRRALGPFKPRSVPLVMALGSLVRLVQRAGRPDPLGCYERWLEAVESVGGRATWFFLPGHYSRPHPYDIDYTYLDEVTFANMRMTVGEMIARIGRSGAEIGLHGSYLSPTDAGMLRDQRLQLESASGTDVRSIRQHYLRFDPVRTPQAHESAGLRNDSTLGFNESSGFRVGTSLPFSLWNHEANQPSSIVEVPMVLMDGHFRSLALSGDAAERHCRDLIETVERLGGCLTINWHPNHIHNETFWSAFTFVLREASRRGAWFGTVRQVADAWRARAANTASR